MYERSLFISDVHIPFEDVSAVKIIYNFVGWFKPNYLFLLGDICDFYAISKFDKDPQRANKLQEELTKTSKFLGKLRNLTDAKIIYFEGNHEARLTKYLWQHPEIAGLNAVKIENLLGLTEANIEYVTTLEEFDYHSFQIEHGDIIRKHSGYTARGQIEKRGVSGISGHTHRLGTHYLTNMGGDFIWLENGCLCNRNPEYVKRPNWQNGFSVGWFKLKDNRFAIEQVCITGDKAVYAGKEFK